MPKKNFSDAESTCMICGDELSGADDTIEIYESIREQIRGNNNGASCELCGKDITAARAAQVVAAGVPKSKRKSWDDEDSDWEE